MLVGHININYPIRPLHQELVRALGKKDINNIVFAPTYDKMKCKVNIDANVFLEECFKKNDRFFYFVKQRKIINAFDRIVRMKKPGLLHAHTLFSDGNAAMSIGSKYNIPYIVAVRNTDVNAFFKYRPWLIPLGIEIMHNSEKVVFLSEAYKEKVISSYVPKRIRKGVLQKSVVIQNGIDEYWLDNMVEHKTCSNQFKSYRLLSVCEVNRNKNLTEIIEAMKILQSKGINCELTIVGKATDNNILRRILQEENVDYVPPQPKEKLIEYYRKASIFVMPSHTETFGLVYAEALSQGLPVVYTRGQGFDGQFEDGSVGFAVSDKRPDELAEAIMNIGDKYQVMSENALRGAKKFSWDSIAEKYFDIYKEV